MTKAQALNYLFSSGKTIEQVTVIARAFGKNPWYFTSTQAIKYLHSYGWNDDQIQGIKETFKDTNIDIKSVKKFFIRRQKMM